MNKSMRIAESVLSYYTDCWTIVISGQVMQLGGKLRARRETIRCYPGAHIPTFQAYES